MKGFSLSDNGLQMSIRHHYLSIIVIFITLFFGKIQAQELHFTKIQYECGSDSLQKSPLEENYQPLRPGQLEVSLKENPHCIVWLSADISLSQNDIWAFQILYPTLDWIQPWIDGKPLAPQGGRLEFASRIIPLHLPTWTMPLPSGIHHLDLAVIDTTGKRRVSYVLMPVVKFLPELESRTLLDGVLIGLLLFHMLAALILAFILGDDFGGRFYAAYVVSTVGYLVIASGHAFPLFWPTHPFVNSFILMFVALLSTGTLSLWVVRFENAKLYYPRIAKFTSYVGWFVVFLAFLMPLSLAPFAAQGVQFLRTSGFIDGIAGISMLWLLGLTVFITLRTRSQESIIVLSGFSIPLLLIALAYAHDLRLVHISQQLRLHMLEISGVVTFAILSGILTSRLHGRLKRSTELEHRYSTSVVQAADRVRERIARELHDDIAQRLVALQYGLYNGGHTEPSAEVRGILKDLRALAHSLHPAHLLNGKLGDALHTYAREFDAKGICHIVLQLDPSLEAIEGEPAVHLLRIFQELTNNALQHGQASEIQVMSIVVNNRHQLRVLNDGLPIDKGMVEGFGLTSIRARLRLLNGSFEIKTASSELGGPELVLSFPL